VPPGDDQAARNVSRKRATSSLNDLACWVSLPAEVSTSSAASPVCCDAPVMPATFSDTSLVPSAARKTFALISLVAADCSSMAEAMAVAISLIEPMLVPMRSVAPAVCRLAS